jgi:hypothetical protein
MNTLDEIFRVIVGNELKRIRYAFDQIILTD